MIHYKNILRACVHVDVGRYSVFVCRHSMSHHYADRYCHAYIPKSLKRSTKLTKVLPTKPIITPNEYFTHSDINNTNMAVCSTKVNSLRPALKRHFVSNTSHRLLTTKQENMAVNCNNGTRAQTKQNVSIIRKKNNRRIESTTETTSVSSVSDCPYLQVSLNCSNVE